MEDLICFMAILIIPLQTEFKGGVLDSASPIVCPSACFWPRMLYTNGCIDFYENLYTHYSPSGEVHID